MKWRWKKCLPLSTAHTFVSIVVTVASHTINFSLMRSLRNWQCFHCTAYYYYLFSFSSRAVCPGRGLSAFEFLFFFISCTEMPTHLLRIHCELCNCNSSKVVEWTCTGSSRLGREMSHRNSQTSEHEMKWKKNRRNETTTRSSEIFNEACIIIVAGCGGIGRDIVAPTSLRPPKTSVNDKPSSEYIKILSNLNFIQNKCNSALVRPEEIACFFYLAFV